MLTISNGEEKEGCSGAQCYVGHRSGVERREAGSVRHQNYRLQAGRTGYDAKKRKVRRGYSQVGSDFEASRRHLF